jgi:ketol-acid reductoisomerase
MCAADASGEVTRVAVLGTGIMGSAMARNLVTAGFPTTVWDRSVAATTQLTQAGARVAGTAAEAVADAHVVITMLPTPAAVHSVMFNGGVAKALSRGAAWAQMGTLGEAATVGIVNELARLRPDVVFVDAPLPMRRSKLRVKFRGSIGVPWWSWPRRWSGRGLLRLPGHLPAGTRRSGWPARFRRPGYSARPSCSLPIAQLAATV